MIISVICLLPVLAGNKGTGPQKPIKKSTHWSELLGRQLSRNHVFKVVYIGVIYIDFRRNLGSKYHVNTSK